MWEHLASVGWVVGGAVLGVLFGLWLARRQRREVVDARNLMEQAVGALRDKDVRIEGLLAGCVSLEKERNQWKNMYYECGIGYGAAQQLLLVERDGLLKQLRHAKITPRVDRRVEAVTKSFEEKFAEPVRQAVAKEAQEKAGRIEGGKDSGEPPAGL